MSGRDDLLRWRAEFPTLEGKVHLVSHSLGAMPRGARARVQAFLERWEQDSVVAWGRWIPEMRALADVVARVVGAPEGSVALSQNVSTAQAIVASCFDFDGPRRKVVYSAEAFPTVHYLWREQRRRGAEIEVLPADDDPQTLTERIVGAIDERTLIVPVSHVLFRSGAMLDLPAIVERAREVGALVFADCYQSAGTVPLQLEAWGVDIACGGSVKWACGGPGTGWLYVRPDLAATLEPAATGWFGHAEPFAFDMGPMRRPEGVERFLGGTPPIPAFAAASAGWEIVAEIGVERIRERSLALTGLAMELARERGFSVRTPEAASSRGGTVCFDFEGAGRVAGELAERGVLCDWRPGCGLRIGPHFYNTEEEIRRLMDEVDRIR